MRPFPPFLLASAAILAVPAGALAATPWQPVARVSPRGEQVGRAFAVSLDARGTSILVAQRAGIGAPTTTRLRLPGGRTSVAAVVPASTTVVDAVHLAADARGDAVLAWVVFDGTRSRVYAAYRPAGRGFGPSVPLTPFLPLASSAYPAIDARGHAVVVWGQSGAPVEQVVLSERSATGAWSAPVPISAATLGGADPGTQTVAGAVAFDARGALCVTWSESGLAGAFAVKLRCRAAGGAFGTISTLSRPGDHSYRQYLALDPAGNALVAWWNDGDSPAADRLTMEWRLRSAAGVVGPIRRAPDAFASDPAVAARGSGRFDLFWSAGEATVRTRFAEVRNGVAGVPATLGSAAPNVGTAIVASDGASRVAAAWYEQPASGRTRIELAVLRPHGPRLTHVVGTAVFVIGLGVAVDATGDALVTWADAPLPILLTTGAAAAPTAPVPPSALFVAGYDRAAPVARLLAVPRRAVAGRRVRLRVVPRDVFGPVRATWRFGDGGVGKGLRVRHAWQAAGRYRVTLQLLDRAGNRRRLTRVVTVR
jgi:hypothetical protein